MAAGGLLPVNPETVVGWKEHVRAGDSNIMMRILAFFTVRINCQRCEFFSVDTLALGLNVFVYFDTNITADYMMDIRQDPDLKPHILDMVCDLSKQSKGTPRVTGALVLYLRTSEYTNAHPISENDGATDDDSQDATAASTAYDGIAQASQIEFFADMGPVHRALAADIAAQLQFLQGPYSAPVTQDLIRKESCGYEFRTFGFQAPITIAQLRRAERIDGVTQVYVNFAIAEGQSSGALIVRCIFKPESSIDGFRDDDDEYDVGMRLHANDDGRTEPAGSKRRPSESNGSGGSDARESWWDTIGRTLGFVK